MAIIMKSDKYRVVNIFKKTNAKMFKNIKVGDIIQFSTEIEYAGTSRGRSYSIGIKVVNLSKQEVTFKTFNELPKLLEKFELEDYHGQTSKPR